MSEPESLSLCARAERSIGKTYRSEIWNPFVEAVKRYELLAPGDRVAVCVSGGKDSMLLAKLMQLLLRFSEFPFELRFLAMDPGYNEENRRLLEENAEKLEIPLEIFETNVFRVANRQEKNPCYLCAKMRRGHLYAEAQKRGCNKIALGHHFNDVIETTVMAMLYGSQLQAMPPKLHSQNYQNMELIRPLYCVREADIIRWVRYNGLTFLQCACRFTENAAEDLHTSKRAEVKNLLRELTKSDPNIPNSVFRSIHAVNIETFPGLKYNGETHYFTEHYSKEAKE